MTGKWATHGVPHKGWICVDVEDLGAPDEICKMCETQEIRFVHYMRHPDYPHDLGCGCICAGKMEEDYEGSRQRETILKNAAIPRAARSRALPCGHFPRRRLLPRHRRWRRHCRARGGLIDEIARMQTAEQAIGM
jgi:hypothetical protein